MPVLTAQTISTAEDVTLTLTSLDGATDTFTASQSLSQALLLVNTTGADITITAIGDGASASYYCTGYGNNTVDPVSITVPANATVTRGVNQVGGILKGVTTITNGIGLNAALINLK